MSKYLMICMMLLMACLLLLGCGIPQETYNTILSERDVAVNQAESLQAELEDAKTLLQEARKELSDIKTQLSNIEMELRTAKTELESYEATGIKVYMGIQPPYGLSPYGFERVELINNQTATNPTWGKLYDFLIDNDTDEKPYSAYYMCGEFAQNLHNNAEALGIRAAYVVIHFKEASSESHALNGFYTTDKGLVYIDCTGEELSGIMIMSIWDEDPEFEYIVEWDKVAYVQVNTELGYVSVTPNISLDYASYRTQLIEWQYYVSALEAYNSAIVAFNSKYGLRFLDSSEYAVAMSESTRLDERREELLVQLAGLGPYAWESNGVVEKIEIYW